MSDHDEYLANMAMLSLNISLRIIMIIIIKFIITITLIIMINTLPTWPCRHPSQDCRLLEFYEIRRQGLLMVRALPMMIAVITIKNNYNEV